MPDFLPGPCLDAVLRCQQALARFHRKRPLSDLSIHWNPVSDYLSREMLMSNVSRSQVLSTSQSFKFPMGNKFQPCSNRKSALWREEML
uniref:Putative ovule protein n=1 Tax=Solanum chacoense TaxID=4108 RepID=A0A0V0HEK1_SOLCH